jgi:N-acetylmuramic acid 6-phosphate etherase
MKLVLGIDGGGSKTTALLAGENGAVLGRGSGGPCAFQALPEAVVRQSLRDAVSSAFAAAGLPLEPATVLGLGLSGVDRPGDHLKAQRFLKEENFARENVVVNDGELPLWCGGLQGWGISVISGTGSIVIGRTPEGNTGRAGGWGYRFGDEGSGFMIGTDALRAVACADDLRGPQTLLTRLVLEHWGLEKPSDLIPYVYQGNLPYAEVAKLAALVHKAASRGDAAALEILNKAAAELIRAAEALCRRLGLKGKVPAALGGGVLLNIEMLRTSFVLGMTGYGITLEPLVLVDEPAQGAVRMAINHI